MNHMSIPQTRERVAIIGSGVSGLTAAYLLRHRFDVTVFEADDRLGGHAHTHDVNDRDVSHRVDSGFIVHNDRTYPHLRRLFAELNVGVRPTEMSMSIHCDGCGLEYSGGRGATGIFAQRRRLFDPRYLRMLMSVKRFQRLALQLLDSKEAGPQTYGHFLDEHRFSDYFVDHYAIPFVSCVWSSGGEDARGYPARYLFEFLRHHGFLTLKGSPQWFTVVAGSHSYISKIVAAIGDVRINSGISSVTRNVEGVELIDTAGIAHSVDRVVIATHADQALRMLADPTRREEELLGTFTYSRNATILHRDDHFLPLTKQARSAWNYRMDTCHSDGSETAVTYWMNRLQGIESDAPLLVTLNPADPIAPAAIVAEMTYEHPIFTTASVAAAKRIGDLFTDQTIYVGAYQGWGFHEDGCRSAVDAVATWGVDWQ